MYENYLCVNDVTILQYSVDTFTSTVSLYDINLGSSRRSYQKGTTYVSIEWLQLSSRYVYRGPFYCLIRPPSTGSKIPIHTHRHTETFLYILKKFILRLYSSLLNFIRRLIYKILMFFQWLIVLLCRICISMTLFTVWRSSLKFLGKDQTLYYPI